MVKANFLDTLKVQYASQLWFFTFFKSSVLLNVIIEVTDNNEINYYVNKD